VRSVARAHRGEADAAPRAGGGLTVRVTLPALRDTALGDTALGDTGLGDDNAAE
jgi:hypothetical protein